MFLTLETQNPEEQSQLFEWAMQMFWSLLENDSLLSIWHNLLPQGQPTCFLTHTLFAYLKAMFRKWYKKLCQVKFQN